MASPDRFLRIKQVKDRTTFGWSRIYRLMKKGEFPQSVKIGGTSVAWRESDIQEWMDAQPRNEPVSESKAS